jgi:hypothetical protein
MKTEIIYVSLPNEAVPVWTPVDAEHVSGDLYRILDCRGEDDGLEFSKGAIVRCRLQVLSGDFGKRGECLVAYETSN